MTDLRRFNARQNGSPEAFEPPDLCCASGHSAFDLTLFVKGVMFEQLLRLEGQKAWQNRISSWSRQPP
jgi:hypothetical protein